MKDGDRDFISCPVTFMTYRFTDIYIKTNDAEPVIPSASFAIQQQTADNSSFGFGIQAV